MPHVPMREEFPGIQGLMNFRPESAIPLNDLVEVLLWDDHPLTRGERHLISTFVAYRNGCEFAHRIHGATAAAHLADDEDLVDDVRRDYRSAAISPKLKTLLAIADEVVSGGKNVTEESVAAARAEGATDLEIHDTVLIGAAFCMYSRYIDGLAALTPDDQDWYRDLGKRIAANGYRATGKARRERLVALDGAS